MAGDDTVEVEHDNGNGKTVVIYESWRGRIAFGSFSGLLLIAVLCWAAQPAYWAAITAIIPILAMQVGHYMGTQQAAGQVQELQAQLKQMLQKG